MGTTNLNCVDFLSASDGIVPANHEAYTSPAAQRGIEWMREHYRRLGQTPRFLVRGRVNDMSTAAKRARIASVIKLLCERIWSNCGI